MRPLPLLLAILLAGCGPTVETKPTVKREEPAPVKQAEPDPPIQPSTSVSYQRLYPLENLETTTLEVNGKKIKVWLANDDGKRTEGMMGLTDKDVKPDEGMLFVFPAPRQLSFWMQNTILPLDIVYINPAGTVLNVQQGKPLDETGLPSDGPGKYVLELKQGGAKRLGIAKGSRISIPKNVTAKN